MHVFASLEHAAVRKAALKVVSLPVWENLTPAALKAPSSGPLGHSPSFACPRNIPRYRMIISSGQADSRRLRHAFLFYLRFRVTFRVLDIISIFQAELKAFPQLQRHWQHVQAKRKDGWAEATFVASIVEDCVAKIVERDERYWCSPELHRVQGELFRSLDRPVDEVETSFQKALEIADEQGALFWKLRTASSLADLWDSMGRREEARGLLRGVYEEFTEGLDTGDLKRVKEQLDRLEC